MLKSYGGYTWTNKEPEEINSEKRKLLGLTGLAVAATGGMRLATNTTLANGYRPVDYMAGYARLGGNLFPFQLANTFRIPEILSPFLSDKYRGAGVDDFGVWGAESLKSHSSYNWLKYTTGLSDSELSKRGINRGMAASADTAEKVIWTPEKGAVGRLESVFANGEKKLLSPNVSLYATTEEFINPLSNRKGLNKFIVGVFGAADMYTDKLFKDTEVFSSSTAHQSVKAPFIPGPAIGLDLGSYQGFKRSTTWARGIASFEMGRYNVLLQNVLEQFAGEPGKRFFERVLRLDPQVLNGPASHMFARYGMAAVGVGAGIITLQQTDWMRRNHGFLGRVAGAGIISGALSFIASRMGSTSKTSALLGAGAFATQMILPGFDKGFVAGIATTGVNLDILRGNALNPFNYYRRSLEGFFPGISDWKTGAALAVGSLFAANITLPGMSRRLNQVIAENLGQRLPMFGSSLLEIDRANRSTRDLFFERVGKELGFAPQKTYGFLRRNRLLVEYNLRQNSKIDAVRNLNAYWHEAEGTFSSLKTNNKLNNIVVDRLRDISTKYSNAPIRKEALGFLTQAYGNFFGADLSSSEALLNEVRNLGFGKWGPTSRLGRLGAIAFATFGIHQLVTGGLLGSMENAKQLKDIYSGKELIEMKKSRWWEGGGTPFEGGETSYFRPHAYALYMNRIREKSIWGEDEDKRSPIGKFLTKNFTYDLEKQNYWSRPYPISSAAFQDIPIIGNILASSIGAIIKPSKLMHTSEWMRGDEDSVEYANVFKGGFIEPSYELGAVGPGRPISPYAGKALVSDIQHQFQELEGMTGWGKSVLYKTLFGNELFSSDDVRLQSANAMSSWGNRFWEAELGGLGFSNEFLRRVFPRKQSEVKPYNPIKNNMPAWMPDKFHYGDPYELVQWGEARLPGVGFAGMHPELKGVDPEAYPLLYKYQILADVAPLTPEFFKIQNKVFQERLAGNFSAKEVAQLDRIEEYHKRVVNKNNFDEMDPNAIALPFSGITRGIQRGLKTGLLNVVAPLEYLVPMGFRPAQKLLGGDRDPIRQYEYERMYGTPLAFWDKPFRDWIRPSVTSLGYLAGWRGKPFWRREADNTNAYFDKIEFIKYMQLSEMARQQGQGKEAAQYLWSASQTRAGVNPNGSPLSMYWALQGEERPYFNAFANTTDPVERNRILQMVPKDEAKLYQALWNRIDQGDPGLYKTSTQIDSGYMRNQYQNTLSELGNYPIPKPDWIGWNGDVDMSDIQVRYVERIGSDLHDYGMWESDIRKSKSQPFLEGSEDYLFEDKPLLFSSIRSEMYNMLGTGFNQPKININPYPGLQPQANIVYNDDRHNSIAHSVRKVINGY